MFPYTSVIEHICFGPRSQMQMQVKRTQPPWGGGYSCSLKNGIFLSDGSLAAFGDSLFSIWWWFMCVRMSLVSLKRETERRREGEGEKVAGVGVWVHPSWT